MTTLGITPSSKITITAHTTSYQLQQQSITLASTLLSLHVYVQVSEDAEGADGGAPAERAAGGAVAGAAPRGGEGAPPWPAQPPPARARQAAVLRTLRHDVILPQGRPQREQEVPLRAEGRHHNVLSVFYLIFKRTFVKISQSFCV